MISKAPPATLWTMWPGSTYFDSSPNSRQLLSGRRLRGCLRSWRARREIYLRHLPCSFRRGEVSVIRLESRPSRENVVRKLLDVGVVVLQRVVITLALDRDPVLGAREFVLQAQEILIGPQLRIILHDQQQSAERSVQLPIGRDLFLWRSRRKQRRPSLRDVAEYGHFLLGIALDRLHQIGDQIGAPLQHNVYLRPRRLHAFVLGHQRVPHAYVLAEEEKADHPDYNNENDRYD